MKPLMPPPKTVSQEHIGAQLRRFEGYVMDYNNHDLERRTNLITMYQDFQDRLRTAPASSKTHYHNAYEGGYLDHVLKVIDTALLMKKLYKHQGGVIDFTDSELVFAAMHHDFGKLGDEDGPLYTKETDPKWIEKGYTYKTWDDGKQFITSTDRTFYVLQKYNIRMTKNEYLGIKLTDGLYEESNARYFKAKGDFPHRTSMFYILHWADHMAARIENDEVRVQYNQLNNF